MIILNSHNVKEHPEIFTAISNPEISNPAIANPEISNPAASNPAISKMQKELN